MNEQPTPEEQFAKAHRASLPIDTRQMVMQPTPETDAVRDGRSDYERTTRPPEQFINASKTTFELMRERITELERERDEARGLLAGRDTLAMWQYECGHIVRRKEHEACSICSEIKTLREQLRLANEDAKELFDSCCTAPSISQWQSDAMQSHRERMKGAKQ